MPTSASNLLIVMSVTADVFCAKPIALAQRADDSELGSTPTTCSRTPDTHTLTRSVHRLSEPQHVRRYRPSPTLVMRAPRFTQYQSLTRLQPLIQDQLGLPLHELGAPEPLTRNPKPYLVIVLSCHRHTSIRN